MRRNYPQVGMVPASADGHIRPINTIAMKAHARPVPSGMFAAVFFTLLFILSVVASRAQGRLILTGKVLTAEATELRAYGEIVSSDGGRMPLDIRPNGRFWVCAPANDRYTLLFSQAGTVAKEIIVDGRKACIGRRHDRKVQFDVMLFADGNEEAMRFAAPVGLIEFRSTKGDAHVTHHYEMIPVSSLMALED